MRVGVGVGMTQRHWILTYCLPGWIEKQYIKNSIWWWNNHYLPGIKEQELLCLTTEDMEEFITYSVGKIAEELNGWLSFQYHKYNLKDFSEI